MRPLPVPPAASTAFALSLPLLLAAVPTIMGTASPRASVAAAAPTEEPDRSPADVALTTDGRFALTANRTAGSVSLVDLQGGKVVAETKVGAEPFAVAISPDGKRAAVSCYGDDSLILLTLSETGAAVAATVPVGDEPRGVALDPKGTTAYVALAGEDAVVAVDLTARKVVKRLPTGTEPWYVALTPDGSRVVVGSTRGRTVAVLDPKAGAAARTVKTLCRNLRTVAVSPDGRWAYLPGITERGMAATRDNIDRGWVVGNRLIRVPLTGDGPREAITLDTQGDAVGDVEGVALSPDGGMIALTAGGTHELLLFRSPETLPFIAYGGPGDHIDPALRDDTKRYRRVKLGGRPTGVRFSPDGKSVVVANHLLNSLQVVDVATGKPGKTIPLGGPAAPSLARRGEAIFLDADRSFNSWYSCYSCHTEGHSNGGSFDTFNDGSYGKPKKTLSLRGVARTAPYTWHGWQKGLDDAVRESLVKSMQGEQAPTAGDVEAVVAYLKTLDFPQPRQAPASEAIKRGERVFAAKACASCHGGPDYATPVVLPVGLESDDDAYKGFNPPALRGVRTRAPYLHDGRAGTLEEVLTEHHRPSKLTGKSDCTPQELADLVDFLKSL